MLTTSANEHAFARSNAHCELNFVLRIITSAWVCSQGLKKNEANDRFGSRQLESYGVCCWGLCRQVGLRWTWVALSSSCSFDCGSILESLQIVLWTRAHKATEIQIRPNQKPSTGMSLGNPTCRHVSLEALGSHVPRLDTRPEASLAWLAWFACSQKKEWNMWHSKQYMDTSSYFSTSLSCFQQLSSKLNPKLQFIENLFPVADLTWIRPSSQNLTDLPMSTLQLCTLGSAGHGRLPKAPWGKASGCLYGGSRFRSMEHMKEMEKAVVMWWRKESRTGKKGGTTWNN